MQTSSQEIAILPRIEAINLSLCEDIQMKIMEMGILLLPAQQVKHTETTIP